MEKQISPMLFKSHAWIFNDPDYIYEIKWDGFRCLARKEQEQVRLISRNGWTMGENFPEIVADLRNIPHRFIFDGELVILQNGLADFSLLQGRGRLRKPERIEEAARNYPATLIVFDILNLDGMDLTAETLLARKQYLAEILPGTGLVVNNSWIEGEGKALFEATRLAGHEGIVAKRKDSIYYPGKRVGHWLKIKHWQEETVVITGYKIRPDFGLLVTTQGKGISTVRQGISPEERQAFLAVAKSLKTAEKAGTVEIRPFLKCIVQYKEWTNDGRMRHPLFLRFVTD
jgi:DNA ligase D-like protein (predicted ligase)